MFICWDGDEPSESVCVVMFWWRAQRLEWVNVCVYVWCFGDEPSASMCEWCQCVRWCRARRLNWVNVMFWWRAEWVNVWVMSVWCFGDEPTESMCEWCQCVEMVTSRVSRCVSDVLVTSRASQCVSDVNVLDGDEPRESMCEWCFGDEPRDSTESVWCFGDEPSESMYDWCFGDEPSESMCEWCQCVEMVTSQVSRCDHPAVQQQFFETVVRYERFFSTEPQFLPDVLVSRCHIACLQSTSYTLLLPTSFYAHL